MWLKIVSVNLIGIRNYYVLETENLIHNKIKLHKTIITETRLKSKKTVVKNCNKNVIFILKKRKPTLSKAKKVEKYNFHNMWLMQQKKQKKGI